MAFLGWFKKDKKQKINVATRKQNVLQDSAAAIAFAEAGEHESARRMMDPPQGCRKILTVGTDGAFSDILVNYAVDMAKRLDFEIVALSVTEVPLTLAEEKRAEATALFTKSSEGHVARLKKLAEESNIPFTHIVEIGHQNDVIAKLHARYQGMRYVLTEPDPEVTKKNNGSVDIPVVDLGCYQNAAA